MIFGSASDRKTYLQNKSTYTVFAPPRIRWGRFFYLTKLDFHAILAKQKNKLSFISNISSMLTIRKKIIPKEDQLLILLYFDQEITTDNKKSIAEELIRLATSESPFRPAILVSFETHNKDSVLFKIAGTLSDKRIIEPLTNEKQESMALLLLLNLFGNEHGIQAAPIEPDSFPLPEMLIGSLKFPDPVFELLDPEQRSHWLEK